ncbi:MAG: hypothetical protein AAGC92_05350 [Pseudomonadota bacterium]
MPQTHPSKVAQAAVAAAGLPCGAHDGDLLAGSVGQHQSRSLGTGRNPASTGVISIACAVLSFLLPDDVSHLDRMLARI